MAIRDLALPIESDPGRYGQDGGPRLVNVYPEKRGAKDRAGKQQMAWYASAGLRPWTLPADAGPCRGLFAVDPSRLIAVLGQRVYSIDSFGAATFLGGLLGDRGVTFARNTRSPSPQIVVVGDGGQRKVITGGSMVPLADPDLLPPNSVDVLAGYILFGHADGRFSWSAINDATSIAALAFATAEGKPDGLVRLKVVSNQIWLLGETTTEIWGLTRDADSPFERVDGTYIDVGCLAPLSVTQIGQRLAWVANDATVRLAAGYQTEVISTHAVSTAIAELADPTTIEASVLEVRGHQFLRLNSAEWTWVYDATPGYGTWHEERSVGLDRRRAAYGVKFGLRQIAGDLTTGQLWTWDAAHGVDGASPLMCRIVTAPQHVYPGEVEFNALYIDGLAGSGLNTPGVSETEDPVMLVRDSDDGDTWSSELALPIGRLGQTSTRTVAHQLGTSGEDGRSFELVWDAAANKAINAASVDAVAVA